MKVVIIGGGAAGMLCGALAAEGGAEVTVLEQNEKLGKKLFITGKGRCNFTNACSAEEFRANVVTNAKFLYSASEALTSEDVIALFESWGLRTKVERGRRAFPASDHSSDVIRVLSNRLKAKGANVILNARALRIITEEDVTGEDVTGEDVTDGEPPVISGVEYETHGRSFWIRADAVVLATGGLSYPSTGSTGDGYSFARKMNLAVTDLMPSLVPMNCRGEYIKELQGLSLRNVELIIRDGKKEVFRDFGELLFTHFGISGPLVLSASAKTGPLIGKKELTSRIDLKPAISGEEFGARLQKIFDENAKKQLKNVLHECYPAKMVPVILRIAGIDGGKRCCDIRGNEREQLVLATKAFPVSIISLRGYNEAVITKGGVSVREIDPKTMAAKKVKGLYLIGELLDVDAFTGGYNLQIAWCTAAACARDLLKKKA